MDVAPATKDSCIL